MGAKGDARPNGRFPEYPFQKYVLKEWGMVFCFSFHRSKNDFKIELRALIDDGGDVLIQWPTSVPHCLHEGFTVELFGPNVVKASLSKHTIRSYIGQQKVLVISKTYGKARATKCKL
uniref:Uncharacterized protein n=1 Tax=Romanomermis culicivorax TaxID=13658 RepID=A0A915JVC8_ROMCU